MQLYRMSDNPHANKAAIPVADADEARLWNTPDLGFGVFRTVNSFDGPRRKEFLSSINAWPIDIDEGDKAAQAKRIMGAPLVPTAVIETKRGYQVYWVAKQGALPEHWNALVLERLVPYFGADKNARDLCRILRAPGFLHLKDPADPFKIRTVWKHNVSYTERQVAEAFPWVPNMDEHRRQLAEAKAKADRDARDQKRAAAIAAGRVPTEDLWDAIGNLDCRDALERLSGSGWVNGEFYTFKRTGRGRWNIFVDGRGSSCFVDENGKIGSLSGGGPCISQWLRWLGRSTEEIVSAVCSVYPHLAEIDEQWRKRRAA